jgi:hypothetical protein
LSLWGTNESLPAERRAHKAPAGDRAVVAMLGSDEYAAIRADYDRISREHFARS